MKWLPVVISIIIANAAGAIGSLFTMAKIPTWYAGLMKPAWNPPSWVFGPVWTTLFILMGIAAALVWLQRGKSPLARRALVVYGAQLVLNVLWSVLFFGYQSPGAAFICIIALLVMIAYTIRLFWRVRPLAGWLLVPYIAWVSFASILNFTIWQLNDGPVYPPIDGVACTQEAKLCPDGSYVGRSGPRCEFSPCPPARGL